MADKRLTRDEVTKDFPGALEVLASCGEMEFWLVCGELVAQSPDEKTGEAYAWLDTRWAEWVWYKRGAKGKKGE